MHRPEPIKSGYLWALCGLGVIGLYAFVLMGEGRPAGLFGQSLTGVETDDRGGKPGYHSQRAAPASDGPTGRGVPVGHVEGNSGDYLPNTRDPAFAGVKMTARSGPSKVNGHAQSTARILYGRAGFAPGVDDVNFYTTSYWMGRGSLKSGTTQPPVTDGRRVVTHSWIGHGGPFATNTLRRLDYLIDTESLVAVVGVNNKAVTSVPLLLASAHNAIAVGVANGNSSGGYTRFEGVGRCKPDVVGNRSTSSETTPIVASIVAKLLEAADRLGDVDAADRPEVIKAVIMAGASKPPDWEPGLGRPLDEHLGAGVARFSSSFTILRRGPIEAGRVPGNHGWTYHALPPKGRSAYNLSLETDVGEVSIMLVWHRRIDGRLVTDLLSGAEKWLDLPRVADFNLRLLAQGSEREDRPSRDEVVVARSASKVDNVEHVYLNKLAAGQYRIEVARDDSHNEDWSYALAWRIDPPVAVPDHVPPNSQMNDP